MPTNLYYNFGFAPFRRAGCKKSTYGMRNKVQITLDGRDIVDIPISFIFNHLDCINVKIISPDRNLIPIESHNIGCIA